MYKNLIKEKERYIFYGRQLPDYERIDFIYGRIAQHPNFAGFKR